MTKAENIIELTAIGLVNLGQQHSSPLLKHQHNFNLINKLASYMRELQEHAVWSKNITAFIYVKRMKALYNRR